MRPARTTSLALLCAAVAACGGRPGEAARPPASADADAGPRATTSDAAPAPEDGGATQCPDRLPAPRPLPGVTAEERTADYWVERARAYGDPDAPLLTAAQIDDHDRAMRVPVAGEPLGWSDLLAPIDPAALQAQLAGRLRALHDGMAAGDYVDARGGRFPDAAVAAFAPSERPATPRSEWRVALAPLPIRCGPREEGLFTAPVDPAFDRNQCGSARPQEPLRVVADWGDGWWIARTASSFGWIRADAPLSPPASAELREVLVRGPRVRIVGPATLRADDGATTDVPEGTIVPLAAGASDRVWFATADGFHRSGPLAATLRPTRRDLTRRAFLEEAFARLDAPYGWGGRDGGLDCSGFVEEVFAAFDLELPRHSARQALAGSFSIDVGSVADPARKLDVLEAAAARGIVVLQFPGHIMLYLGRAADGTPMAIHAFSDYLAPCGGTHPDGTPRETDFRADRVDVSDLALGAGTSRGSFLERLDRITVFAHSPGGALDGVAELRQPAPVEAPAGDACRDSPDVRIFRSPRLPDSTRALRVIATTARDLGPVELALRGPGGERVAPPVHRLGGPPWTWWIEVDAPLHGDWTAVLGDGARVEACKRFRVARGPSRPRPHPAGAPPWTPTWKWERDTDNLYAAFVEQLFREPDDASVSWPDLQTLLRDPQRNLLHDHLGLGEDDQLALVPDCADLPYFLRAYFAWKLRLPFAFRRCTRGHAGIPPLCSDPPLTDVDPAGTAGTPRVEDDHTGIRDDDHDHESHVGEAEPTPQAAASPPPTPQAAASPPPTPQAAVGRDRAAEADEVAIFADFITRVANTVQSATARTAPGTDVTDLYPVALARETLVPGTVFADPYGHTLVVARWIPQGLDGHGTLLGADAQPDGTIGRRPFWRGDFLFTPATTDGGAGFKAWRPATYDRAAHAITTAGDAELRDTDEHPRWSDEQYRGSADDFYDRMESLIDPRPLDPHEALAAVVDALEETVRRRVVAVANGEAYVVAHPDLPIAMPEGYDVFETEGPWEDFATPSRDMRLLIAIDVVLGFPDAVAREPGRYGLAAGDVDAVVAGLRAELDRALAGRSVQYVRTDGATQPLTLHDVVDRRAAFEVAYDPNDCIEVRWGAPPDSAEAATCTRRAPPDQRARLEEYRPWFHARTRPPR